MIYFIGKPVDFYGIQNSTIEFLLEYFKDIKEVGFDTETEGFDPYLDKLLVYQLGDNNNQFVVDALMYPIELVRDILMNTELIIHNAKFDLKFCYHQNIYPPIVWDTYLGECVLYKGDKTVHKSLEATTLRYFQYQLTKSSRGLIFREGFSKRFIEYCAEDVKFLSDIKFKQTDRLNGLDLMNSMALENLFVKVLTYIEYSGIYIDVELWKKKIKQDKINYNNSIAILNNWILENNITRFIESQLDLFSDTKRTSINWSSPKDVVELFQSIDINTKVVDDITGEMKDSVESVVLEKQSSKSPLIPIYLTYKKYEKILSTYGESVLTKIHPITGRIHTSFTQIMSTGRLSSGGKIGDKETINLQNIPKLPDPKDKVKDNIYERQCFTHEKGNSLVNADYSGQEQIIFANWTLDKDILDFYEKDMGDMHSFVASKIYPYLKDVPLNIIKIKYKKERQIAKSTGFAINYGGDGSTIADNLGLSREEGDTIYKAYFTAFPGVSSYFKKVTKQSLHDGYILFNNISRSKCFIPFYNQYKDLEYIVTRPGFWEKYREEKALNSRLYLHELKLIVSKYFKIRGNISRMALNFPIQGSAAEITKLAGIYLFQYLVDNNLLNIVKFSNVIHDELLIECPSNMVSAMAIVVEDCMIRAGKVYCKVVPLKAEVKICDYWDH